MKSAIYNVVEALAFPHGAGVVDFLVDGRPGTLGIVASVRIRLMGCGATRL